MQFSIIFKDKMLESFETNGNKHFNATKNLFHSTVSVFQKMKMCILECQCIVD